ncbi:hypothetical protein M885DRAFT_621351 [Pelagophyceae sp. CCMP2097]|nr:hypothetical protein M885DRAFT_621351 [Pelagophyceae sp. CCMP2097]
MASSSDAMRETVTLGLIFLLIFSAYYMIQGYASLLFGEALASDALVALYATFTVGCLFASAVVAKCGARATLMAGVAGYAAFSLAALAYAAYGGAPWARALVVAGGAANGCGAALLWTAQGALVLANARDDAKRAVGAHFGVFWALFNASAVLGGVVTFAYFSSAPESAASNAPLYVIFTALIGAGGLATLRLRPGRPRPSARSDDDNDDDDDDDDAPGGELRATLRAALDRRAALLLPLFWYTGFNQPYQLNGFADRFFRERVLGLELAAFYSAEVLGAFVAARVLDGPGTAASAWDKRRAARRLLTGFFAATTVGYGVAGSLEYDHRRRAVEPVGGAKVALPTLAFVAWGLSDALVQTYAIWVIDALFAGARQRTRLVALYKLVQSAGPPPRWCAGYAILPQARCPALVQLVATGACYIVGTAFALCQLPEGPANHVALLGEADYADRQSV